MRFCRALQVVIDAFIAKQGLLTKAGINTSRARMAYFWANIEHECGELPPEVLEPIR